MSTVPTPSRLTKADADRLVALIDACRLTARRVESAIWQDITPWGQGLVEAEDSAARDAVVDAVRALVSPERADMPASGEAR